MAHTSNLCAGRKWSVDAGGMKSLTREYVVVLDGGTALAANGETLSFPGVPAIGTAHPVYTYMFVSGYDITEGANGDKNTLRVSVKYEPQTITTDTIPGEEEPTEEDSAVEEWGWSDGTETHDLVEDRNGEPVINSAGDPFDSAPQIEAPAPVFTKVIRTLARRSVAAYLCKVNASSVTIGGRICMPGTLLCTVAEQRIFNDALWKYRYKITLRYRSNLVAVGSGSTQSEIGWDVAVADTGMRAWDTTTGKKSLIRVMDLETGKMATVTSPALLDGSGHAQQAQSSTQTLTPYYLCFQAYDTADFPAWFYSEP